jgi:hypothetical protein
MLPAKVTLACFIETPMAIARFAETGFADVGQVKQARSQADLPETLFKSIAWYQISLARLVETG